MVIQSYDVTTSSQRTFMSIESTTMLATREIRIPQALPQGGPQTPETPEQEQDTLQLAGRRHGRHRRRGFEDDGRFRRMHKDSTDESLRHLSRKLHTPPNLNTGKINRKQTQKSKIPSDPNELRAQLMQMMLEMILGRGSTGFRMNQTENDSGRENFGFLNSFGGAFGDAGSRPQVVDGWRVEHFQFEAEQVSYQAQGVVKTADGRTINVDINMFMSRQFVSYMGINVETTRPIDPLVINYGGTASSLLGERFMFDLTSDGSLDSLAVLGEGSGFLAIDRNGDGIINDGSELFGPSTGCGFSELRKYDKDGNGWIDANDEIFDKLLVWHRDKDGNDTIFTLKELGIGAIYLGDIETEFSFKGDNNETLGIMRSTSFFLKECGGAGTVSHIDMMV